VVVDNDETLREVFDTPGIARAETIIQHINLAPAERDFGYLTRRGAHILRPCAEPFPCGIRGPEPVGAILMINDENLIHDYLSA
jgi:hypothetical protein